MSACFIVRAELAPSVDRDAFDRWYEQEHLPDALAAFHARRAWRGWSDVEQRVHYAFYEFDDLAAARAITGSEALRGLVAEFDRLWGDQVTRTRDIVPSIQRIGD